MHADNGQPFEWERTAALQAMYSLPHPLSSSLDEHLKSSSVPSNLPVDVAALPTVSMYICKQDLVMIATVNLAVQSLFLAIPLYKCLYV